MNSSRFPSPAIKSAPVAPAVQPQSAPLFRCPPGVAVVEPPIPSKLKPHTASNSNKAFSVYPLEFSGTIYNQV